MQRLDVGMGMGGTLQLVKYTITYQDFVTFTSTQTASIALPQNPPSIGAVSVTTPANYIIPEGGVNMGVKIHHTSSFIGSSSTGTMTNVTVSLGTVNSGPTFLASPFNVFQAPGDNVLQETANFKSGQMSSAVVYANFVSTGSAMLSTMYQGSVDLYMCNLNVSTSNIGTSAGVTSVALLPNASGAGVGV